MYIYRIYIYVFFFFFLFFQTVRTPTVISPADETKFPKLRWFNWHLFVLSSFEFEVLFAFIRRWYLSDAPRFLDSVLEGIFNARNDRHRYVILSNNLQTDSFRLSFYHPIGSVFHRIIMEHKMHMSFLFNTILRTFRPFPSSCWQNGYKLNHRDSSRDFFFVLANLYLTKKAHSRESVSIERIVTENNGWT